LSKSTTPAPPPKTRRGHHGGGENTCPTSEKKTKVEEEKERARHRFYFNKHSTVAANSYSVHFSLNNRIIQLTITFITVPEIYA